MPTTHVEYILDTETWIGPYEGASYELAAEAGGADRASGVERRGAAGSPAGPVVEADLQRDRQRGRRAHGAAPRPALRRARDGRRISATSSTSLVEEGKAVAAAAGIELHDDPWEMNVLATQRGSAHYPSMLEDVEARRPTEVELINGSLVREAAHSASMSPLQTAIYRLVKAKEASYGAGGRFGAPVVLAVRAPYS